MAAGKPGPGSKDSTQTAGMKPTPGQDSLQTTGINRPPATASKDSLQTVGIKRPLKQAGKDSTQTAGMKPTPGQDSLMTRKAKPLSDSMTAAASTLSRTDTLKGVTVMDTRQTDSIRLFHAFHHVRIFSDSLQGVCDSLSYSSRDSIFRFFKDPVLWANDSQVSGDTIYLFTKNKKADQIFVFENGFSVNRTPESYFNQIKGNRLNGYFKDGNIDYMRAKGNAESVYYLQDDDSAYIGMNYARADAITMYFVDKDLKKVTWVNGVEGTTYPFKQIPDDKKELRNFKWQESRRPKTKYELFGQ
jgi:hypothetical protein